MIFRPSLNVKYFVLIIIGISYFFFMLKMFDKGTLIFLSGTFIFLFIIFLQLITTKSHITSLSVSTNGMIYIVKEKFWILKQTIVIECYNVSIQNGYIEGTYGKSKFKEIIISNDNKKIIINRFKGGWSNPDLDKIWSALLNANIQVGSKEWGSPPNHHI